jgi:hypothetical protein
LDHKVAAAEQTMREEIKNSLIGVAELDRLQRCRTAQLVALQDAVASGDDGKARQILASNGSAFGAGRLWADNAFEATLAAQVGDHLGSDKLRSYSQVYQIIRGLRRYQQRRDEQPSDLAVLYFAPNLSPSPAPDVRYARLREIAEARLTMLFMGNSGETLRRYARNDLGLTVTEREYLAAPGRADIVKRCEQSAAAVEA